MAPRKKPEPKQIVLNEEQRVVADFRGGYACCLAGPGSGKSACAVIRVADLVKEGVPLDDLLVLTFTKTAAKNFRDRVEQQVGNLEFTRTAGFVTFHSLALSFAQIERKEFSFELAEFPLASEPVANKLSGNAARRYDLDPRSLRPYISLSKRNRVSASQAVAKSRESLDPKQLKLALAYKEYDKLCKSEGLLDFDSLMYQMVEILSKKKDVRERWQYKYILTDEAQDNCKTDWQLLKLLSEKYGNLCCVGDPGQSVFGFRGSDPKLFLNMEEMFPGTQKMYLATNYRSTPELVGFLKEIGPVPELSEKFKTSNGSGPPPRVKGFRTAVDEANWVIDRILGIPENGQEEA